MTSRTKSRDAREPKPAKVFAFPGLWRDGKLLVIDLERHKFPHRCLKTNQPLEEPQPAITLAYTSSGYSVADWLRCERDMIYPGLGRLFDNRKRGGDHILISLNLPLTLGWRRIMQSLWGWRLMAIGIGAIGASSLCAAMLPLPLSIFRIILASAAAVMIVGALFNLAISRVLPIRRWTEGKIWLGGVHRDWLQSLPPFVPSREMLNKTIFEANVRLWSAFFAGILPLMLVLVAAIDGINASSGRVVVSGFLVMAAGALLIGNWSRMQIRHAREQLAKHYPPQVRKRRHR